MKYLIASCLFLLMSVSVFSQDGAYLETGKNSIVESGPKSKVVTLSVHGYNQSERVAMVQHLKTQKGVMDASTKVNGNAVTLKVEIDKPIRKGELFMMFKSFGVPLIVVDGVEHNLK